MACDVADSLVLTTCFMPMAVIGICLLQWTASVLIDTLFFVWNMEGSIHEPPSDGAGGSRHKDRFDLSRT